MEWCICIIQLTLSCIYSVVLRSPSPWFFKSSVYQHDTSPPQKVSVRAYVVYLMTVCSQKETSPLFSVIVIPRKINEFRWISDTNAEEMIIPCKQNSVSVVNFCVNSSVNWMSVNMLLQQSVLLLKISMLLNELSELKYRTKYFFKTFPDSTDVLKYRLKKNNSSNRQQHRRV